MIFLIKNYQKYYKFVKNWILNGTALYIIQNNLKKSIKSMTYNTKKSKKSWVYRLTGKTSYCIL